jgi:hypothetical protein
MTRVDRKVRSLIFAATLGSVVLSVYSCSRPQRSNPALTPPVPPVASKPGLPESDNLPDKTPVKDALVALLDRDARTDHVFPSGVQVKSVTIADRVVTVDFSHEFGELANKGETVESDAQYSLRKVLAKFTTIDKMRVTVEGKPFDSQATDWYTPFAVREADTDSHNKKVSTVGSDSASR